MSQNNRRDLAGWAAFIGAIASLLGAFGISQIFPQLMFKFLKLGNNPTYTQSVQLSSNTIKKLENYISSQNKNLTEKNKAIVLEEALEDYVNTGEPHPKETTKPPKETTKPPKVQTFNRQLQCVHNCDYNGIALQVTVVSFTFDTNLNKTLMHLLLESQHNESGCNFGGINHELEFQDERTGKKYPNDRRQSFTLVARESRKLIAEFSFLPSPGSTYTLIPKDIECDGRSVAYAPVYGDVQFTFQY